MKIIPIHYERSMQVGNWFAIEEAANEMAAFIDGKDYGRDNRGIFALHHSQVNDRPFDFFVLNPEHLKEHVEAVGSRFVVNPKIVSYLKDSVHAVDEGCTSFPFRKQKRMPRAMVIIVEYEVPDPKMANGLRKEKRQVERVVAQVFQHECEHGEGKNIFFSKPKS